MSIFTNKAEATVFTYHLVDGSYIMAEEVDYDFEDNIIFVINPVEGSCSVFLMSYLCVIIYYLFYHLYLGMKMVLI